jgi:hypothetical protein
MNSRRFNTPGLELEDEDACPWIPNGNAVPTRGHREQEVVGVEFKVPVRDE